MRYQIIIIRCCWAWVDQTDLHFACARLDGTSINIPKGSIYKWRSELARNLRCEVGNGITARVSWSLMADEGIQVVTHSSMSSRTSPIMGSYLWAAGCCLKWQTSSMQGTYVAACKTRVREWSSTTRSQPFVYPQTGAPNADCIPDTENPFESLSPRPSSVSSTLTPDKFVCQSLRCPFDLCYLALTPLVLVV
jgi:hypothetical protein